MRDIVFEKGERPWLDSKQNKCLCRTSCLKDSLILSDTESGGLFGSLISYIIIKELLIGLAS